MSSLLAHSAISGLLVLPVIVVDTTPGAETVLGLLSLPRTRLRRSFTAFDPNSYRKR